MLLPAWPPLARFQFLIPTQTLILFNPFEQKATHLRGSMGSAPWIRTLMMCTFEGTYLAA